MSRFIKGVIIGIPAVIIAGIIVFYFSFNSIVKKGVEAVGPKLLGADVVLQEVNISMFSGKGQLKGIVIGNPEGFQTESAFKLGEVRLAVDVASIFSDKMVIDEIVIDAPEITYETSGGQNNIEALLENINKFVGKSEEGTVAESQESQESQKKIQINDFIMSNARVNLSATIFKGKKFSRPLPDMHLKDIGKDNDASMADALKEIFAELNKNIASVVTEQLKSQEGTIEKAVDKIKSFFK